MIFPSSLQQNLSQKKPKGLPTFWAILKKPNPYVKTALPKFWATFGKFGLLYTPTSGHTAVIDHAQPS